MGSIVVPPSTIAPAVQEMLETGEISISVMRSIANQCESMVSGPSLNTTAGRAVLAKVQEIRNIADRLNHNAREKANTMGKFSDSSVELQASQAAHAAAIPSPSVSG